MLQERKTVRKLRAALDEHAPPSQKPSKITQFPKLAPSDNERKFERFMRAIQQTNTLADARRFRSEVASQLRKDSIVEGQDPVYLRRLESARNVLDTKVATLSAGGSVRAKVAAQEAPKHKRSSSRFANASLREVLYDASGLSCFMEFMDQADLMRLVQFWIVVDGFRNPLEVETDEGQDYVGALPTWNESDRADLAQIYEAYLSKPELKILPVGQVEELGIFLMLLTAAILLPAAVLADVIALEKPREHDRHRDGSHNGDLGGHVLRLVLRAEGEAIAQNPVEIALQDRRTAVPPDGVGHKKPVSPCHISLQRSHVRALRACLHRREIVRRQDGIESQRIEVVNAHLMPGGL